MIIFIDQIDSMMAIRSSNDSASVECVKSIVLKICDGLHDDRHQVVLAEAKNGPDLIDSAFFRRLNHRIHMKLPSNKAKSKIFKLLLRDQRHALQPSDVHELVHDKDFMKTRFLTWLLSLTGQSYFFV